MTVLRHENAYLKFFFLRLRQSSALKRPKTLMKTEAFENGFKSGAFWKRIFLRKLSSVSSVHSRKWRLSKMVPEISYFVFVETKTSTFKNALVWSGPEATPSPRPPPPQKKKHRAIYKWRNRKPAKALLAAARRAIYFNTF